MKLKIVSTNGVLVDTDVKEVIVPVKEGEIGILPEHAPYTGVIKGGICKFKEENVSEDLLSEGEYSIVSIGDGVVYTDGKEVRIAVSEADSSIDFDEEKLKEMKKELEKELEEIKAKGSIEDIEKALFKMNKLLADIELSQIKKKMY